MSVTREAILAEIARRQQAQPAAQPVAEPAPPAAVAAGPSREEILAEIQRRQQPEGPVGGQIEAPEGTTAGTIAEPIVTLVTGAIAEPLAGLAGLAQSLNPFAEEGAGARAVEATREALTITPPTQAGQAGLQAVGEIAAPVVEGLEAAEKFLGDETFKSTGSPTLAAAATTIPTALLEVLGVASAKGAVKTSAKVRQASKDKAIKQTLIQDAPSIERLKDVSRGVYKELDEAGVTVSQPAFNNFVDGLSDTIRKEGLDPDLTPKANAAINRLQNEVATAKTITEIDTLRKVAQNAASSIDPSDARLGAIMIENIDNFLDNLDPKKLARGAGGADVGPKFKVARELWGRARRSEMINDAFEKAKNQASGFENGIVVQFRSILNNKKKSKFFKKDELQAMRDVVRGTKATDLAKLVGRLGFSEGHATNLIGGSLGIAAGAQLGGPIGAVAVPVIGQVSRKLAQRLTRKNGEFADAVVRAGPDARKIIEAYQNKTPKKLRDPEELSQLLARPDIALDELVGTQTPIVKEAIEISRGRRVLNAVGQASRQAAPVTAGVGALEASQQELAP
jgi:hypothetical protein